MDCRNYTAWIKSQFFVGGYYNNYYCVPIRESPLSKVPLLNKVRPAVHGRRLLYVSTDYAWSVQYASQNKL